MSKQEKFIFFVKFRAGRNAFGFNADHKKQFLYGKVGTQTLMLQLHYLAIS